MIERNFGGSIWRYDSGGPETKDRVASIEIKDPSLPESTHNSFCIGFRLIGSENEVAEPESWQYDHTNYYTGDSDSEPTPISEKQIEEILGNFGSTLGGLLTQYCKLLERDPSTLQFGRARSG